MSFVSEKGQGGVSIVPSARKSIHNHSHCPFRDCEAMGRYGLGVSRNKKPEQTGGDNVLIEGRDEVDNVMSKFTHPTSPISTRKNEVHRRNSLNLKNQSYTDDSDEAHLSQSSPAIFSPYSYSSDEPESNAVLNSTDSSTRSTTRSSPQQSRLNESRNRLLHSTSSSPQHKARRNIEDGNISDSRTINLFVILAVVIVGVIVYAYVYGNIITSDKETNNFIYNKLHFFNDIKVVGDKYKIRDNAILQVKTGIATIFERQDTGSFIFTYNSDRSNFNTENFNNFVNELAAAAAKYLRNHTKTVHHVVVDTQNLHVQTEKELMNEYFADVDRTGVMLVKELDRVPSNLVMAFHYYCDEYNPLVKKSAIFFTLNMAKCSNGSHEKYTHDKIEKCLADKWKKVPQANIRPLLARVVNVVIDITSDF